MTTERIKSELFARENNEPIREMSGAQVVRIADAYAKIKAECIKHKYLASIKGTYINREIEAVSKVEARKTAKELFSNIPVSKVIIIKEIIY